MLKWYNNINLGFILGNTMLVRADHPYYTAEQITRHEIGHDMIAKGEVNVEAVRKKLVETTNKKRNQIVVPIPRYANATFGRKQIWFRKKYITSGCACQYF